MRASLLAVLSLLLDYRMTYHATGAMVAGAISASSPGTSV